MKSLKMAASFSILPGHGITFPEASLLRLSWEMGIVMSQRQSKEDFFKRRGLSLFLSPLVLKTGTMRHFAPGSKWDW